MCGFFHSTDLRTPVTLTGLSESYSAANEWWESSGSGTASRIASKVVRLVFISSLQTNVYCLQPLFCFFMFLAPHGCSPLNCCCGAGGGLLPYHATGRIADPPIEGLLFLWNPEK